MATESETSDGMHRAGRVSVFTRVLAGLLSIALLLLAIRIAYQAFFSGGGARDIVKGIALSAGAAFAAYWFAAIAITGIYPLLRAIQTIQQEFDNKAKPVRHDPPAE